MAWEWGCIASSGVTMHIHALSRYKSYRKTFSIVSLAGVRHWHDTAWGLSHWRLRTTSCKETSRWWSRKGFSGGSSRYIYWVAANISARWRPTLALCDTICDVMWYYLWTTQPLSLFRGHSLILSFPQLKDRLWVGLKLPVCIVRGGGKYIDTPLDII